MAANSIAIDMNVLPYHVQLFGNGISNEYRLQFSVMWYLYQLSIELVEYFLLGFTFTAQLHYVIL